MHQGQAVEWYTTQAIQRKPSFQIVPSDFLFYINSLKNCIDNPYRLVDHQLVILLVPVRDEEPHVQIGHEEHVEEDVDAWGLRMREGDPERRKEGDVDQEARVYN